MSFELDRYVGWIDKVVSGGARGVDRMAVAWAKRKNLASEEFLPDLARYGSPAAYFVRNHQIVDACDLVLAFWDGRSSGTREALGYAQRVSKPFNIVELR